MPSGLISYIAGGGNTASSTTTITSSAANTVYVAITDPGHTHASAWASIYNAQQQQAATATTAWTGLGAQTSTTPSTGIAYWIYDASQDRWFTQEEVVEQSRYVRLARQRVEYSNEQLAAIAAAQEEARRHHEEQLALYRQREAQAQERHRAALARSRMLLLSHLTREQRKTFEENNWFIVQGGKSKKKYRIRTNGYTGNIEELGAPLDVVTHRLCGHLRPGYALHDHHVMQKISLEFDEEAFVRICNRHAA